MRWEVNSHPSIAITDGRYYLREYPETDCANKMVPMDTTSLKLTDVDRLRREHGLTEEQARRLLPRLRRLQVLDRVAIEDDEAIEERSRSADDGRADHQSKS
jgi:hypothetical protein